MNIIQRNFFTLLRSGAFGSKGHIEPMSAWKWNRLYQLSLMHGVTAIVYDGISNHDDDFFMQMPNWQLANWQRATEETELNNRRITMSLSGSLKNLTAGRCVRYC